MDAHIYQQFIHCGEEIEISPAFIVNMCGCNLNCPTCSERIHWQTARRTWSGDAETYANLLAPKLETANIKSFEWIGGEPTLYLPFVLKATELLKAKLTRPLPFYLNTNGYYDVQQMDKIVRILDGFVFDLKACPECSDKIIGKSCPDYFETVCANILKATESDCDVIVRHLVMPGHVDCCAKYCVQWLKQHAPSARLNLMTTFQNFNDCPDYPFELKDEDLKKLREIR